MIKSTEQSGSSRNFSLQSPRWMSVEILIFNSLERQSVDSFGSVSTDVCNLVIIYCFDNKSERLYCQSKQRIQRLKNSVD
jgi:hypothetical protein